MLTQLPVPYPAPFPAGLRILLLWQLDSSRRSFMRRSDGRAWLREARLTDRLARAAESRLTIVSAPPGFGNWTSVGGRDPIPFARTVNGQSLTSAGAIESAAAGLVAPINVGPDAVILGTISGR